MVVAVTTVLLVFAGVVVAANLVGVISKILAVRRDAADAWSAYREDGAAEVQGLDETGFRRAYFRAYAPLGAIHAYVGVLVAAILTLPATALFGAIWRLGWRLQGEPQAYAEGFLIWQFYVFFSTVAAWVLVVALVMQRYHRNRPRALRHELARERDRSRTAGAARG